jgi:hypothetical protein
VGTLYIDTGGSATNSGSRDENAAILTGSAATASGVVVSLDGSPDLSSVIYTAGPTQDSIYLAQATNSNQKIFWITNIDNVAKTVTTNVAPTGIVSSAWAIGGRHVLTNASIEGAPRAGDVIQFNNSPAASASTLWTCRTAGDNTSGWITLRGKAGTRPVLTNTSTNWCINANNQAYWKIENLELQQQGASGNALTFSGYWQLKNVKVSDSAGGFNISIGNIIADSEFSGIGGTVFSAPGGAQSLQVLNSYIHDNTGNVLSLWSTASFVIFHNNIVDSMTGKGLYIAAAYTSPNMPIWITQNTFYRCGDSAIEITDKDVGPVILYNNIFKDNGNAAGEYNFEQTGGTFNASGGISRSNIFSIDGIVGGGNTYGITLDSTDIVADPLFVDAPNGDFSLQSTSPAKAGGYPGVFLGGPIGYLDIGAVQRQEENSSVQKAYSFIG